MKLKTLFSTFATLALLITSPSISAENFIDDAEKAKIVTSYPFLGVEPDASLNTLLAYFERMGYEKISDALDEATKSRRVTFQNIRPPQTIKVNIIEAEEQGKRTIQFNGTNPDKAFSDQITDVIANDLCEGKFEKRRAPDNNAALSCIKRPRDMTAVKAKAQDSDGAKYNLSFIRRGDTKLTLVYNRDK